MLYLRVDQVKHVKVAYPCGIATGSGQLECDPAQALSMASSSSPLLLTWPLICTPGYPTHLQPSLPREELSSQAPGHITAPATTLRRRRRSFPLEVLTRPGSIFQHTVPYSKGVQIPITKDGRCFFVPSLRLNLGQQHYPCSAVS